MNDEYKRDTLTFKIHKLSLGIQQMSGAGIIPAPLIC